MVVSNMERTAKELAKQAAVVTPAESVQTVKTLATIGQIPYPRAIKALRQLETMNAGKLYLGRRGFETRFQWSSTPKSFVQKLGMYDWEVGNEQITAMKAQLMSIAAQAAGLFSETIEAVNLIGK